MLLKVSQKIGAYVVKRLLGQGGMGEVYEVVHEQLQTSFALKLFVPGDDRSTSLLRERFLAEARAMNRLHDPNVVRVYDLGVEDSRPYLVMDLMVDSNGNPATLAAAKTKGGLSEETIYGWYLDLRKALDTIHGAGIVHRDIKLGNILLGEGNRAMLSDFGVARYDGAIKQALSVENTFVTGQNEFNRPILGTITYLAPEVCKGERATEASDLYSLGVAIFKLLTGISYENGINLAQLLQPFSPCWMKVLPALLSVNPDVRATASVAAFSDQEESSFSWSKCAAIVAFFVFASITLYFAGSPVKKAYAQYQLSRQIEERRGFFDAAFSVSAPAMIAEAEKSL